MTSEYQLGVPAKRIVWRLLRGLALLAYTLAFAELFVRIFHPQALMPRYVTGTSWGVRGNIPNASYWHDTPDVHVQYRINSQGMRADREYPLQAPPLTCRVAVFGDSFFMGYEVSLEDTYAAQLEALLRAQGFSVEVLNFSVSGFGTAEMLRTYEGFARNFGPNIVVFEWHHTDPDDNLRSGLYRLENDEIRPGKATYLPAVKTQDFLMRFALFRLASDHSHLYTFLRESAATFAKRTLAARGRKASGETRDVEPGTFVPGGAIKRSGRLSAALLIHTQRLLEHEGRDFYLVEIPRSSGRTQFHSPAEALPDATRAQLKIVSPMAVFKKVASPTVQLYYGRGPGHLTPLGNRLVAEESVRSLAGSPSLASCRQATR